MLATIFPYLVIFAVLALAVGGFVRWRRRRQRARTAVAVREHLALLAQRGLPLGPGLLALAREHGGESRDARRESEWIQSLAQRLDAEGSLVRALAAEPGLYARAHLDVLGAAETRGALPQALAILVEEERAGRERSTGILTLLSYPITTTAMVFSILLFTDVFIVPKYKAIFESMNIELPALTEGLLALGDFLEDTGPLLFLGGIAALALAELVGSRFGWSPWRSWVALARAGLSRLPVIGRPLRHGTHARWLARTAALLEAGATLPEALEVSGADAPRAAQLALAAAATAARAGEPAEKVLALALSRDAHDVLPPLLLASSSGLPAGCRDVASRLRDRSARRVDAILRSVEFVPVLPAAALVAAHFWGIFLPILKLQGAMIP